MAEDKKPKAKVTKQIIRTAPQSNVFMSPEDKAAMIQKFNNGCAIVKMLDSKLDHSDPMNPKQVGKSWNHYIDSIQGWEDFLQHKGLLPSRMIEVVQLPENWPTEKQWLKKQADKVKAQMK